MRDFRGKINLRQRANKLSLITIFLWSLVTELHTGIFLLQTFFKIYGLTTVAEDASYLLATGQMGLLGHGTCFPWSQPQGVLGLPFSSLQILALLLGVIGLILGLKMLKTDSGPFQLLRILSPEAVTETSGQGILTGLLTPSDLMRIGE